MGELWVWAPNAREVRVEICGDRHALARGEGGWWATHLAAARPGADYAFVLDDGPPLPDPRSRWQPRGVGGFSRILDPKRFPWTDDGWQAPPLSAAAIYELHVGTFTPEGTFAAAAARLDALVDLGVTHVELMPVNTFSGRRGWGYDGVLLFAPHAPYGSPDDLRRFVDVAHARGLAVLLDVVYNHLGPVGNHLAAFGPYFTDRYTTPWGLAVNLDDRGSDEVRRFFCDNARMWLTEYHFDGLRIDAVHAFFDRSAVHFLEELAETVHETSAALRRHLIIIGESDLNDPRLVRSAESGGYGFDAQWSDDFHHALHALLTGERAGYYQDFGAMADLAAALRGAFVYDGRFSRYRGRRHGRPIGGLSGHRFLAYAQTHDQVGNRPRGERMSQLLSEGRLRIAAALTLTAPFVPMLFQGEEWGASTPFPYFSDHADPALAEAVRAGRRAEHAAFGWAKGEEPHPQAESTFASAKLRWAERGLPHHQGLLEWHQRLLALRREVPSLRDGRLDAAEVRYDERAGWMAVSRGEVTVAFHLGTQPASVPMPTRGRALVLAAGEGTRLDEGAVTLGPDGVAVLAPAA